MTTFRSRSGGAGGALPPARAALTPGYFRPGERAGLLLALLFFAASAAAQDIALPSGLSAALYDVVLEADGGVMAPDAFTDLETQVENGAPEGNEPLDAPPATAQTAPAAGLARFRLRVEGLAEAGWDGVAGDFLWLCEAMALPSLAANGWSPAEVVIALADREVEFGATDPEAVQFFEGFRIADKACIPQAF